MANKKTDNFQFQFCPNCKFKLIERDEGGKLLVCRKCGFHYYNNPVPCVAVILINKKGKLLFVVRKNEPKIGFYDLAGGFVEEGESFENAAKRELKEELGVSLELFNYAGSTSDNYEFKGIIYKTVTVVLVANIDGKIYPADDVLSVSYFDKKNIPFERFAFPGLSGVIKKYIGRR